jgi:hypothetical protein
MMKMKAWWGCAAVLIGAWLASTARADEPPWPGAPPPLLPGPAEDRGTAMSVGGGIWLLTVERADETRYETLAVPALTLEFRRTTGVSRTMFTEFISAIVVQDFELIGDGYAWYGEDSSDEGGSDPGAKVLLLWPGLILMPFAGSNLHTGYGVTGYLSERFPAAHLSGGAHMAIYLRPSEDDFIVDFGVGLYAGAGVDFSRSFGIDLRTYWAPPFFHALNDSPEIKNFTSIVALTWYFSTPKRRGWLF